MTTYVKHAPVFDVFEGSGSNQNLIGTLEPVPLAAPVVFQFLPNGLFPLSDPAVLRSIANRLEFLNANPPL